MQGNLIIIPRVVNNGTTKRQMVQPCTDSSRCKIKNWNERSENRTGWEKSIMEAEEEGEVK